MLPTSRGGNNVVVRGVPGYSVVAAPSPCRTRVAARGRIASLVRMDKPQKKQEWAPRIWEGADYVAWLRLLFRNRLAVEPPYWYIAAIASVVTVANMVTRWVQTALHGDRVRETE